MKCRKVEFYPKGESTRVKDRYVSVLIEYIVSENSAPRLRVKAEVSFGVKNKSNSINYARKSKILVFFFPIIVSCYCTLNTPGRCLIPFFAS